MRHLIRSIVARFVIMAAMMMMMMVVGMRVAFCNASTLGAGSYSLLPVPLAPTLTAIPGGKIEPHSDYVRITYVSSQGETTPSDEAVFSAGAGTLTVVHSPASEPSAVGYNVYAVKNNGGSRTGHVLQNASPIPIGTDFTEPANGWNASHVTAPTTNGAAVPLSASTTQLNADGGYVEAPIVNGAEAALVFPSNNSAATELTLTSSSGLPAGLPGPSDTASPGTAKETVVQTIGITFSKNVTLHGLPTLKLTLPRGSTLVAPFVVQFYDGITRSLIATVPGYWYRNLTFISDYTTPFNAVAKRPYYAELIANSPEAAAGSISTAANTLVLPTAGGIDVSATLPPSSVSTGSSYSFLSSAKPPVGLPPLDGPDVRKTLFYSSISLSGTVSYGGLTTVSVVVPPSLLGDVRNIHLAAYDSEYASSAWSYRITPTRIEGRTLTFSTSLPPFMAWRQFGVALYAATNSAIRGYRIVDSPSRATSDSPVVVVVGDSISLMTIIPPSSVGCNPGWGPLPDCQYSHDPNLNWPGVLARMTGYDVINVSALGTQTILNNFAGQSMLSMMVPQIPPSTAVVVCQCGINDLSFSSQSPATSSRAATITAAILARAPRARIIYIGIRCFIGCGKPGVEAWNSAFKSLAAKYGAFVDLAPFASDGASASFPDGSHPSPTIARLIATKVAEAIAAFKLTSR